MARATAVHAAANESSRAASPRLAIGAPPGRMDRNSQRVTPAFHGCRSDMASDRAPRGACLSSRASVWSDGPNALATRAEARVLESSETAEKVASVEGREERRPKWGRSERLEQPIEAYHSRRNERPRDEPDLFSGLVDEQHDAAIDRPTRSSRRRQSAARRRQRRSGPADRPPYQGAPRSPRNEPVSRIRSLVGGRPRSDDERARRAGARTAPALPEHGADTTRKPTSASARAPPAAGTDG